MGLEANNNPWLALSTYEERDEYRFKGRDKDIENMLQLIRQNEYVVCYAASGDGKSSLVNAGVCPSIRREGMFPIKIVFTSDEYDGKGISMLPEGKGVDFDKLILSKIEQNIKAFRDEFAAKHGIDEEFELGFEKLERYQDLDVSSLWWKLRTETIQIPFGEFDYIPVLIFDQFEEMFRAKWKADFFKWLEILSKDICPHELQASHIVSTERLPGKKLFKMIFSMRYEYVGELDYWCSQRTYIPQIMQNRYFLKPLTRNQAMSVIKQQNVKDEVLNRMNEDADIIVDSIMASDVSNTAGDEVSAIMLSLVCYIVYEEWKDNEQFSVSTIGINELIYDYYIDQFNKLSIQSEVRSMLEDVLISAQGVRLRVAVSDPRLENIEITKYLDGTKQNILSARIVKKVSINGEDYVEFIHDRLVDAINKNKNVERKERKQSSKFRRNKSIGYAVVIFIALVLVYLLTERSLTGNSVPIEKEEKVYPDNEVVVTADDLHSEQLKKLDVSTATSLKISPRLRRNVCRHELSCFNNVLYVNYNDYRGVLYAGEAEKLIFACPWYVKINLGANVKKVIILHPDLVQSIKCESNRTRVYVPYGTQKLFSDREVFKNSYLEEMGVISTLLYKIKYELYMQHQHFGNVIVPSWIVYCVVVLLFVLASKRWWWGFSTRKKVALFIWIVVGGLIFNLIYVEVIWMNVLRVYNPFLPVLALFLIWLVFHAVDSELYRIEIKKVKAVRSPICILYNSNEGRQHAIAIKKKMIENGYDADKIRVDLSIIRHNEFNQDIALSNVLTSYQCIAVFLESSLENNVENQKYWKIVSRSRMLCPVVFCNSNFEVTSVLAKCSRTSRRLLNYIFRLYGAYNIHVSRTLYVLNNKEISKEQLKLLSIKRNRNRQRIMALILLIALIFQIIWMKDLLTELI